MLLLESGRAELWRGDILRLPDSGDRGPDGGTADVLVVLDYCDGSGLSLVWVSGYNAGNVWCRLPKESKREGAICIDMDWLKTHWNAWFAYQWNGAMRVIDIERTEILEWDRRMIVEMD